MWFAVGKEDAKEIFVYISFDWIQVESFQNTKESTEISMNMFAIGF